MPLEVTETVKRRLKRLDRAAIRTGELRQSGLKETLALQEVHRNLLESATVEMLEIAEGYENAIGLSHHPHDVIVGTHIVLLAVQHVIDGPFYVEKCSRSI